MAKIDSARELFVEQLKDLYSAENQIITALPKMAEKASSVKLHDGLLEHLEATKEQAGRLEQILDYLGEDKGHEKCIGIEGIIKEGEKLLNKEAEEEVMDAAIVASARKVEHYQMAGYMTAKQFAGLLNDQEIEKILDETLKEEEETDKKLEKLGKEIGQEVPFE